MEYSIYCIEDNECKKYVGITKQDIRKRYAHHKCLYNAKKYSGDPCSSSKLNMNNSKIYLLDTCLEENKIERETYWIRNTDCVNTRCNNNISLEDYENNIYEQLCLTEDDEHRAALKRKLYNKRAYQKRLDGTNKSMDDYYINNKEYIGRRRKFRYYAIQGRLDDLQKKYPDIYLEFKDLEILYKL